MQMRYKKMVNYGQKQFNCSGPEVMNTFSWSTQLSMKIQLLIKTKIPTNEEAFCFKSLRCCIYHANKC